MASNTFIGGATSVAQVDTFTPTSVTTADVNTLTVKNEEGSTIATIAFTVGGTTTAAAVVTGLTAAWNSNAAAAAIATPSGTSTLILTAVNAGVPQYITGAVTGTGTIPKTASTINSGPNDWNTAANWATGSVPATSDTVYLDGNATADILYGLNQSAVDSITLYDSLAFVKSLGTSSFKLKTGNNWIVYYALPGNGQTIPVGSPRQRFDFGSNTFTFNVYASGSVTPSDAGRAALQICGGSSSSKVYVLSTARVDVAMGAGETASLSLLSVNGSGSSVNVGPGTTLVTADIAAGAVAVFNAGMTTLSVASGARVTAQGSGAITTVNANGQTTLNNRSTITTLNVYGTGLADFSQNAASGTVTTLNHYVGGIVKVNPAAPSHITFTNRNLIDGGMLTLS